jgi:uncharacterized membrane-anchored protein YitT (DUF2179 family)
VGIEPHRQEVDKMSFFINAVVITLGIIVALFIAKAFFAILNVTLEALLKTLQHNAKAKDSMITMAYSQERRQRLEDEANQMLAADSTIHGLVKQLQDTPYVEGNKAENYKRSKLQKQLRDLVPNKGLRDIFYGA